MSLKRSFLRSKQLWKSYAKFKFITTSYTTRNCSSSQKNEMKTPIPEEVEKIAHTTHATAEFMQEEIPEAPESGKRLFRDGIMIGLIAMIIAWTWTLYKKQRDNYDDNALSDVYAIRAHIEHALNGNNDVDLRTYHLCEAETHCRKALHDHLGGGYLSNNEKNEKNENINQPTIYEAHIIALHVQLGKICYLLGKYQSAIDNYLIVLKALTQEFGYKHCELLMPCRQISDCYMRLGQYQMSILFLERALNTIDIVNSNSNSNEYAPICQQMAVLFRKQYKWNQSIEYTNKAIKGGKSLLGENHIQIAHMLLGRACCEMELKQWEIAEISARNALKIVEYSGSAQQYTNYNIDDETKGNKIMQGGIKNTIKNRVKNNLMVPEKTKQLQKQKQQMLINSNISGVCGVSGVSGVYGVSSLEQIDEMKCGILYVIGQSLIEQHRLNEAQMIFNNALRYATDLNDTTKQLLIHDQLRDIQTIMKETTKKCL